MSNTFMSAAKLIDIAVKLLFAILIASIAARVFVSVFYQINWDEFFFLSKIYLYQNQAITSPLQTAYVHGFTWLTAVPGDEITQVIVGRLVMLALHCGSLWFLFSIVKRLLGTISALFSVVAYSSFSYVIVHAASFRADPLIGFFMMWAIYLISHGVLNLKRIGAIAGLVSIAMMVSVKAALLMPVLALLALHGVATSGRPYKQLGLTLCLAVLTVVFFTLLYLLHSYSIPADTASVAAQKVSNSYTHALRFESLIPQKRYLSRTLFERDTLFYLLLALGLICLLVNMLRTRTRLNSPEVLVLIYALPMLSFLFYRNSYPYFFPYILLTVSVLVGYFWQVCVSWNRPGLMALLLAVSGLVFTANVYRDGVKLPLRHGLDYQQQVLDTVHTMFPEPVPYIDGSSMIASFPKVGFFMSTWGISKYKNRASPEITHEMIEAKPKFLILNTSTSSLRDIFSGKQVLLAEDDRSLRDNYIPHWGKIYIAGKQFQLGAEEVKQLRFMVDGIYTLESLVPININGQWVKPGEAVSLNSGLNRFQSNEVNAAVTLRFGQNIFRPQTAPLAERVFRKFY